MITPLYLIKGDMQVKFLRQVFEERERQTQRWDFEHDDAHELIDWVNIIQFYLERFWTHGHPKRDCVVIAALAMAAYESLERKEVEDGF